MSKAIRCDRCKKCFDPYTVEKDFAKISDFIVRNSKEYDNNECSYRDENIDLCPTCLRSFSVWFNAGKPDATIASVKAHLDPNLVNDALDTDDLLEKMKRIAKDLWNDKRDSQKPQGT